MEKTKEKCLFSNAKGTRPAKDGRKAIGDSVTCVFAAAFATQAAVKKGKVPLRRMTNLNSFTNYFNKL